MPTYGVKDEELSSQESLVKSSGNFFRNWLASSMQFFREKKFNQKHKESVDRRREAKQIAVKAKAEAYLRFEQQRAQHAAQFRSREHQSPVVIHQDPVKNLEKTWLEEYKHPSSTANVSIHEVMGEEEIITEVQPSISNASLNNSTFDLSSTFNSTAKSLFSTSPLTGNAPLSTNNEKFSTDKLDNYTGARPSFGTTTVTSTPVSKIFNTKTTPVTPTNIQNKPIPTPTFTFTPKTENLVSKSLKTIQESSEPSQGSSQVSILSKVATRPQTPTTSAVDSSAKEEAQEKTRTFSSLEDYYSKDKDKKDDNNIAKERFINTGDPALRNVIKRSINGKLAIVSKKHATSVELASVILYLANLINGKKVESYTAGQHFMASEGASVAFAIDVIIIYCMGVVERDNDLVLIMATILRGIGLEHDGFESVLLGHLFDNSKLLTLNSDKCKEFAESVISNSAKRNVMFAKEQSSIKLFMALHLNKTAERSEHCRLNMHHLWKVLAIILNSPIVVLSTVILTTTLLEISAERMPRIYPRQWPKIVKVLSNQLLPQLEKNLHSSELCQSAGEAAFISMLCNELENL